MVQVGVQRPATSMPVALARARLPRDQGLSARASSCGWSRAGLLGLFEPGVIGAGHRLAAWSAVNRHARDHGGPAGHRPRAPRALPLRALPAPVAVSWLTRARGSCSGLLRLLSDRVVGASRRPGPGWARTGLRGSSSATGWPGPWSCPWPSVTGGLHGLPLRPGGGSGPVAEPADGPADRPAGARRRRARGRGALAVLDP